jgi:sugar/nucleoside kinase (ribokinase family)
MTGQDFIDITKSNSKIALLTLWEKWSVIETSQTKIAIQAVPPKNMVDATWCWDAYRAWLLYWLSEWWDLKKSAELGSAIASIKICHFWGQNHHLSKDTLNAIGQEYFHEVFFA